MAGLLAPAARVAAKIGEPIETPEDLALAEAMLESASNWVRVHSGQDWSAADAPSIAVTITIAAAARGYQNPAGYREERADAAFIKRDTDNGWANEAKLTPDEIAVLRTYNTAGGVGSIISVPLSNPERYRARSDRRHGYCFEVGYQEPFSYTPGT